MRRAAKRKLSQTLGRLGEKQTPLGASLRKRSTVTFERLGQWGQFGNQLFQISVVLGYAAKYGCTARLPGWYCRLSERNYADLFPKIRKHLGDSKGTVFREASFAHSPIPFLYNVDLRGNFQSEKYFVHINDEIQELFAEPIEITSLLDRYCAEHDLTSFDAIQFRFLAHPVKDLGPLEVLPDAYFVAAIARIRSDRPLLASTDNKVLLAGFLARHPEVGPIHVLTFEDSLADFYMLSRAERLAISNSSFGWWAGYLGKKKEVLAPQRFFWFNQTERFNPFWDTADLYPKNFKEVLL